MEDITADDDQSRLSWAANRDHALDLTLILLDADLSSEVRSEAAVELQVLITDPAINDATAAIMWAAPLPPEAESTHAIEIAQQCQAVHVVELLLTLVKQQPHIQRVCREWTIAAESIFDSEAERQSIRAICASEGLFRDIVRAVEVGDLTSLRNLADHPRGLLARFAAFRRLVLAWTRSFIEVGEAESA